MENKLTMRLSKKPFYKLSRKAEMLGRPVTTAATRTKAYASNGGTGLTTQIGLSRQLEELLPQREPFLFVKEILSADKTKTVGLMTYDDTFPYYLTWSPQYTIVPPTILVESLVQCGGAGIVKLGLVPKSLWGLASVEKVRISGVVKSNSTVKLVVENVKISNRLLKQSGTCFCEGTAILQANWLCLQFH